MHYPQPLSRFFSLILAIALVLATGTCLPADAAKKKKGSGEGAKAAAELQKGLDEINKQLNSLMVKVQSRALLSPKEAGQLVELKYKLLDLMNAQPNNPLLARPVYQAGVLYQERESYNDAYELFSYVAQGYPGNPYGAKAKSQIQQLEKRFGADYFFVEKSATMPEPPAAKDAKPKK